MSNEWENFQKSEFSCKCGCGTNQITNEFIDVVQDIRTASGCAMPVNSGYRCPDHPIEAKKSKPGSHSLGLVADFRVSHQNAFLVAAAALSHPKVTALGVSQKGNKRFLHIGIDPAIIGRPRPHIWSY